MRHRRYVHHRGGPLAHRPPRPPAVPRPLARHAHPVLVAADDTATRRAYHAGVYLVRPDGYVAAVGVDVADAYLRRVFQIR